MYSQLLLALLVEAFDGGVLDDPVHPFDLTTFPQMIVYCEPMFDAVCLTDHVEAHLPRERCIPVARLLGELDAVVGQDRVAAVGHSFQYVLKELPTPFVDQPCRRAV